MRFLFTVELYTGEYNIYMQHNRNHDFFINLKSLLCSSTPVWDRSLTEVGLFSKNIRSTNIVIRYYISPIGLGLTNISVLNELYLRGVNVVRTSMRRHLKALNVDVQHIQ